MELFERLHLSSKQNKNSHEEAHVHMGNGDVIFIWI